MSSLKNEPNSLTDSTFHSKPIVIRLFSIRINHIERRPLIRQQIEHVYTPVCVSASINNEVRCDRLGDYIDS